MKSPPHGEEIKTGDVWEVLRRVESQGYCVEFTIAGASTGQVNSYTVNDVFPCEINNQNE